MAMIHVLAVSPPDLTDEVVEVLAGDPCVLNLIVQPGIALTLHPNGGPGACRALASLARQVPACKLALSDLPQISGANGA